jgi:hypothetical protein
VKAFLAACVAAIVLAAISLIVLNRAGTRGPGFCDAAPTLASAIRSADNDKFADGSCAQR